MREGQHKRKPIQSASLPVRVRPSWLGPAPDPSWQRPRTGPPLPLAGCQPFLGRLGELAPSEGSLSPLQALDKPLEPFLGWLAH